METEIPKKAVANTYLDITVECPYCKSILDVTPELKDSLQNDLRAEDIDHTINCDVCHKDFIVERIAY